MDKPIWSMQTSSGRREMMSYSREKSISMSFTFDALIVRFKIFERSKARIAEEASRSGHLAMRFRGTTVLRLLVVLLVNGSGWMSVGLVVEASLRGYT